MARKIQNLTGRQWFGMALKHGQTHDSFTEIHKGTEQYRAWMAYFLRLGWTPYTLTHIEQNKAASWTAPCEWPPELPVFEIPKPDLKLMPAREATP